VSGQGERRLTFPGLLIQPEPRRHYPDSSLVAHLVGYVGEVTEAERAQRRFASVRLGGLLGKGGLERQYDDTLRGADGVRFIEVSAFNRVVREAGAAARLPPVPGRAVHTTIDLELQRYIAQIFPAGQRGAVLALNPNTGEILALYSAPGYDPNAFVGGVDPDYWRRLRERSPPADRPHHPGLLPTRVDLEARDRGDGAEARHRHAAQPHAHPLPGRAAIRQPLLSLLVRHGTRRPGPPGGDRPELRRLFLPARLEARPHLAARRRERLGLPLEDRH